MTLPKIVTRLSFFLILFVAFEMHAQVSLLKDIDLLQNDIEMDIIYQPVELNGVAYFVSTDGVTNSELWRSDGTATGTYLLKDFSTYASSEIAYLTSMGNAIYFAATDGSGVELWKSDGTLAGTAIVKKITPYLYGSSFPEHLTNVNGTLFFSANDYNGSGTNFELWKSDGTAAGTVKVKEIYPGLGNSRPRNLLNVNGILFFLADDDTGTYLWKSDGTEVGTIKLYNFQGNSLVQLIAAKDKVYWTGYSSTYGSEIWTSDGTASGTQVIDLVPGSSSSYVSAIFPINDSIVFAYNDGVTGAELWVSDGTLGGTSLIKDIRVGSLGSAPEHFYAIENTLYFTANDGANFQLWRSNLTEESTIKLRDFNPLSSSFEGPDNFTTLNGKLIFTSEKNNYSMGHFTPNNTLWQSDGTVDGTVPVIGNLTSAPFNAGMFAKLDNQLLFTATPARITPNGLGLWITDGTASGTHFVKKINLGKQGIEICSPVRIKDSLFYGVNLKGIWSSNGTKETTLPYKNDNAFYTKLFNYKGTIVLPDGQFMKNDRSYGQLKTPAGSYGFKALTIAGDDIFYICNLSGLESVYCVHGLYDEPQKVSIPGNKNARELKWVNNILLIDRADDGVFMYKPGEASAINLISGSASSKDTTFFNGSVFFVDDWRRLCKINQTSVQFITSIYAYITDLTPCNNILFFSGRQGNSDAYAGIWKYDGQTVSLVKGGIYTTNLITVDGFIFFTVSTDASGYELWKSDGTTAGTVIVKEIYPGRVPSNPSEFFAFNNILYFSAADPQHGNELWRSDGTSDGTYMIADINPGVGGSYPSKFIDQDNALIVLAKHPDYGQELWKVELLSPETPSNFIANANVNAISLNWLSNGNLVSRFEIYRTTSASDEEFVKLADLSSTADYYEDQEVQEGIIYYYKIRAVYLEGGNSPYSEISSDYIGTITSTQNLADSNLELYPNPATDVLYIKSVNQIQSISVLDLLGNTYTKYSALGNDVLHQLNVSQLSAGVYFIKIENGNSSLVKRFVKR